MAAAPEPLVTVISPAVPAMLRRVNTPVAVSTTTPEPLNPLNDERFPVSPIVGLPETPLPFVIVISAEELEIARATTDVPSLEIMPLPTATSDPRTPLGVIVRFPPAPPSVSVKPEPTANARSFGKFASTLTTTNELFDGMFAYCPSVAVLLAPSCKITMRSLALTVCACGRSEKRVGIKLVGTLLMAQNNPLRFA